MDRSERDATYRVDIPVLDAAIHLSGRDKRDSEKLKRYNELVRSGQVYDSGASNEENRKIVATKAVFDEFYPGEFTDTTPYSLDKSSITDFASLMGDSDFVKGVDNGTILVAGTENGNYQIASPRPTSH